MRHFLFPVVLLATLPLYPKSNALTDIKEGFVQLGSDLKEAAQPAVQKASQKASAGKERVNKAVRGFKSALKSRINTLAKQVADSTEEKA